MKSVQHLVLFAAIGMVAAVGGTLRAGETAAVPFAVTLDVKQRTPLSVQVGDQTFFRLAPMRFGVLEWSRAGKDSGRVAPEALVVHPPASSDNRVVWSGTGTAKGLGTPLYGWDETWEFGDAQLRVHLAVSNLTSDTALTLTPSSSAYYTWPTPALAEDRFMQWQYTDFGAVSILCEGAQKEKPRMGTQDNVPGTVLHGRFRLVPGQVHQRTVTFDFVSGSRGEPPFDAEAYLQSRYARVAQRHPWVLHWPDRRPILASMNALSARGYRLGYSTNPRGFTAGEDVTTPEGLARFRERKLAEARRVVGDCRKHNAQGAILWDLEGQEFRHAITYIGSPDRLLIQAPELDEIADEYFAILADAGIRAGVCVRPQLVELRPDRHPDMDPSNQFDYEKGGQPKYQQDNTYASPGGIFDAQKVFDLLADKIGYAYRRWKVTIFYVDSPTILTADIWTKLARQFPDCLLIPEFPVLEWYGATAPLFVMPPRARQIWPDAFGCVCVRGFAGAKATPEETSAAQAQGHILLGNPGKGFEFTRFVPAWHDPAHMQWRDDQPVSRALTQRMVELSNAKETQP